MSQINLLLKQALQTFTCRKEIFYQNLEFLMKLMNRITIDDVRINPVLLSNVIWEKPNKAPATYVHIYEDLNITVGIFILKPGLLLPLHDHPDMHGLIKVIHGKVKITSYSLNTDSTELFKNENVFSESIIAEKMSEVTVDSSNSCSVLYPEHENIHQVECINGPAAFLDILSPPYDTLNEHGEMRRCNYYKVLGELAPNIFKIQQTESPSTFWTDSAPFIVSLTITMEACKSCGSECEKTCGTRHFRVCCFSFMRKRGSSMGSKVPYYRFLWRQVVLENSLANTQ